jgi:hypothetical protein
VCVEHENLLEPGRGSFLVLLLQFLCERSEIARFIVQLLGLVLHAVDGLACVCVCVCVCERVCMCVCRGGDIKIMHSHQHTCTHTYEHTHTTHLHAHTHSYLAPASSRRSSAWSSSPGPPAWSARSADSPRRTRWCGTYGRLRDCARLGSVCVCVDVQVFIFYNPVHTLHCTTLHYTILHAPPGLPGVRGWS